MKINIFLENKNKNKIIELKKGAKVKDLFNILKLNPVSFIAIKNNEVVTEDSTIKEKDKIEILSVVSGG